MADHLDNQAYDRKAKRSAYNPYAVGPIHLGAAAFTVAVVSTVVAYLHWLAGVDVPAEVIAGTDTVLGGIVGFFFPNA